MADYKDEQVRRVSKPVANRSERRATGPRRPAACGACGGPLAPHLRDVVDSMTRDEFAIDRCGRCGLGHTRPAPSDLGRYYGSTYHGGRHGLTDNYCTRRRVRLLSAPRTAPRGRLLDVGCGDGSFLRAARDCGWQVTGTEMSPEAAREAGFDIGETLAGIADRGPFDCVTMWHSLEHLVDLRGFLPELVELIAPGGRLLVAVPDAGGLQARIFGRRWFHLDVPRHLHHFDAGSLDAYLQSGGLTIEQHYHQEFEYDAIGWVQSALNSLFADPNVLFDMLTGKQPRVGALVRAASLLGATLLTPVAIFAVAVGTLAGRGGTLIVEARRPASGPLGQPQSNAARCGARFENGAPPGGTASPRLGTERDDKTSLRLRPSEPGPSQDAIEKRRNR